MEKLVKYKTNHQFQACKACKYIDNCELSPEGVLGKICSATGGQYYPKEKVKLYYYFY